MANDEKITAELIEALSSVCELDSDTIAQLKPALQNVVKKHVSEMVGGTPPVAEKVKGKKGGAKKVSTKSDKIPHKNGYHFYVAAKMMEIKESVAAKERMKIIGEMWKKLGEDEKKPFQDQAHLYNESVDGEMKTENWTTRREAIIASANQCSGAPVKKVASPKPAQKAEPETEEEVVKTAPAPEVATEAVVEPPAVAPVRRKKTTK